MGLTRRQLRLFFRLCADVDVRQSQAVRTLDFRDIGRRRCRSVVDSLLKASLIQTSTRYLSLGRLLAKPNSHNQIEHLFFLNTVNTIEVSSLG